MSTGKTMLVLLVVLVAFGVVGRMDYEDATRMDRASSKEDIRLSCVRVPIDTSAEGRRSKPEPGAAILVAGGATADVELLAPMVLRCVVVEE